MPSSTIKTLLLLLLTLHPSCDALSTTPSNKPQTSLSSTRRAFVSTIPTLATAAVVLGLPESSTAAAAAAPGAVVMQNTESGIKYAVTKPPNNKGSAFPQKGDIVAIEYTGYLTNGQIFDATHATGQNKALLFSLGATSVIPGLNDIVSEMKVGMKVQAIVPPELAFGDKGICNKETEECLIKPGSTLVYDVLLKKSSIPPP